MFIVNVGWGKCGTTLLDRFIRVNTLFNLPKDKKELNYFRRESGLTLDGYKQSFTGSVGEGSVPFFESSPSYLTGGNYLSKRRLLQRIKNLLGEDVKIVVCLRHPVYRAFSHYIHDLQSFSRFGAYKFSPSKTQRNLLFNNVYANSFIDALHFQSNVNVSFYEDLALCIEIFGENCIEIFSLEKDAPKIEQYFSKLAERLGFTMPREIKGVGKVLEGGKLPTYYYAESKANMLASGGKEFEVKQGELAVVMGGKSLVYRNVSKTEYDRVRRSSDQWTSKLSAEEFMQCYEQYFKKDFTKCLELADDLDFNLSSYYSDFQFSGKDVEFHSYEIV